MSKMLYRIDRLPCLYCCILMKRRIRGKIQWVLWTRLRDQETQQCVLMMMMLKHLMVDSGMSRTHESLIHVSTKNVTPIPTTLSRLLRTPFGIDLTFIRNEDHKKQYCTDAQAGDKIQFFLFVSDSSCNRSVVFSTFWRNNLWSYTLLYIDKGPRHSAHLSAGCLAVITCPEMVGVVTAHQ